MKSKNLTKRIYTSISLFFLVFIIFKLNYAFVYTVIVLGALSMVEFLDLTKRFIKSRVYFLITNLIFLLYISFFFYISLFFYSNLQTKIIIFSLLLCCVFSDVGGFIFGKIFKGPRLTKISPNKTISGAIGSIILSSFVLFILFYFLSINFSYTIIIVAIITSISCQTGDLIFSYLKRKAKIKDTGNFFPGHGGVLDRLDGVLVGIPFGLLGMFYLY